MAAFLKLGDIKGEATDDGHKDWIIINSMSSPIMRSIPQGAKDQQRTKGDTTLGDVAVERQLDKSSTKLQEACASGKFFKEAEIHFCTVVKAKQEPYLKYKLSDVIVSGYGFHGNSSGDPLPSDERVQRADVRAGRRRGGRGPRSGRLEREPGGGVRQHRSCAGSNCGVTQEAAAVDADGAGGHPRILRQRRDVLGVEARPILAQQPRPQRSRFGGGGRDDDVGVHGPGVIEVELRGHGLDVRVRVVDADHVEAAGPRVSLAAQHFHGSDQEAVTARIRFALVGDWQEFSHHLAPVAFEHTQHEAAAFLGVIGLRVAGDGVAVGLREGNHESSPVQKVSLR